MGMVRREDSRCAGGTSSAIRPGGKVIILVVTGIVVFYWSIASGVSFWTPARKRLRSLANLVGGVCSYSCCRYFLGAGGRWPAPG